VYSFDFIWYYFEILVWNDRFRIGITEKPSFCSRVVARCDAPKSLNQISLIRVFQIYVTSIITRNFFKFSLNLNRKFPFFSITNRSIYSTSLCMHSWQWLYRYQSINISSVCYKPFDFLLLGFIIAYSLEVFTIYNLFILFLLVFSEFLNFSLRLEQESS